MNKTLMLGWVERFGDIFISHALPSPLTLSPDPTDQTNPASFSTNQFKLKTIQGLNYQAG
jgi:hypothetical protein